MIAFFSYPLNCHLYQLQIPVVVEHSSLFSMTLYPWTQQLRNSPVVHMRRVFFGLFWPTFLSWLSDLYIDCPVQADRKSVV